jgi:predicted nucleic acid-binding protein
MTVVVDASVAVKWVIPEPASEQAERLLAPGEGPLLAPDLLLVEAANALWKKTSRRELGVAEAEQALTMIATGPLVLTPMTELLARALQMAAVLGHPVYDCVYLALAERAQAPLVTADERLLKLSRRRKIAVVVRSIEEA